MTKWAIGRLWHVIQCNPRSELMAAAKARQLGWVTFAPCYTEIRRPQKRKPVSVVLPYLPGYIFAVADRFNSLHGLSKCEGVNAVLRVGGDYALIADTDPVMRRLLAMADDRGFIPEEYAKLPTSDLRRFKAGDKVVLENCPLALQEAVIEMVDDDRKGATVWVTMFGGQVRTHVTIEQMAEAQNAA